jgi:AraC-like DNA-binding protein
LTITLIDVAVLFGMMQGLIVGLVILFSRFFKSEANQYLALSLLTVSAMIAGEWLLESGVDNTVVEVFTDLMWEYLFPVFFLKYFLQLVQHPLRQSKWINFLFLPFVITAIINIVIDLDLDFQLYHIPAFHNEVLLENYYQFEYIGSLLFVVILDFWSFRIIKGAGTPFVQQWVFQFWLMTTLLIIVWIVIFALSEWWGLDFFKLLWAILSIAFFWITYRGCFQFKLAEDKFEIRQILAQKDANREISPSFIQLPPEKLYFQNIERMMRAEYLYRDPNLSRDLLSAALGISSGYLSQILNKQAGKNFSEYVNTYRVQEVKKMLTDPEFENYSLLSIGLEAGFNSKSTFYATFKRHTGQTPSAYRNNP